MALNVFGLFVKCIFVANIWLILLFIAQVVKESTKEKNRDEKNDWHGQGVSDRD